MPQRSCTELRHCEVLDRIETREKQNQNRIISIYLNPLSTETKIAAPQSVLLKSFIVFNTKSFTTVSNISINHI